VTDREGLGRVAAEWRERAVAAGNAFLTPDWYDAYLATAPEVEPFVVAAGDNERPHTLLPLVRRGKALGFAAASVGDCFGPLCDRDGGAAGLELVGAALVAALPRWRIASLQRVEEAAVDATALALRQAGARLAVTDTAVLPTVRLEGLTWADYLADRSRNFRSELKRKERALARSHRLEYVPAHEGEDVEAALDQHFALHELRWPTARADRGRRRLVEAFHREFARRAAGQGWLRLWQLRVDDRAVASWYGWNVGERYAYYQAGLDPAWGRFSPGTLLLARTIRAATEERCTTYEFLLGEEQYKRRFSTDTHNVLTLTVAPGPSPRLALAAGVWAARQRVRRLPPPLRRTLARALHAVR
jgi:CelD/BcsL family acetyltransferase involved in cellulose biosynthesis